MMTPSSIPVCCRPFPLFPTYRVEVPTVNKPRRACSYFVSPLGVMMLCQRSYLPSLEKALGDDLKDLRCQRQQITGLRP
jgi:hypothetical protein